MGLKDILTNGLVLRRILIASERSEQHLGRIADCFERIADQLAPKVVETPPEELKTTGISYSRDAEMVRTQEFEEAIFAKLGRPPSETEIIDFLDGKAVGLGT